MINKAMLAIIKVVAPNLYLEIMMNRINQLEALLDTTLTEEELDEDNEIRTA